jgi:signal transduction histidine kinase
VTRSRAAADRMGKMLAEVMSEASGDFTPEPEADAEAVLDGLLDVLQPRIEEAGATVTHDPLPTVAISAVQLDRLLQNLVVNAIQYRGDEPPRVHVSAREQKDRWVFAVADNGRGIPRSLQDRIFDRYERGRAGEGDGVGLGLAVCKRIVESHGGSIAVHSEGEGGTTFEFSLPKRRKSGTA